jgi:phosphoglycerate-specific signal transduction histidine kinase
MLQIQNLATLRPIFENIPSHREMNQRDQRYLPRQALIECSSLADLTGQPQEKLQATSRLVTMGELASTLAHELNQPLAAIASYTAGCMNRLESERFSTEEIKATLAKLSVQTQRAGSIVRRVYDFVRKSGPKLALCDLIELKWNGGNRAPFSFLCQDVGKPRIDAFVLNRDRVENP